MDAWIIADSESLSTRVLHALRDLAVDCPPNRVARTDTIVRNLEQVAGFEGLVCVAAERLEREHIELIRRVHGQAAVGTKIVAISSLNDHGTVLKVIRAGASDFLAIDAKLGDELAAFIARTSEDRQHTRVAGRTVTIIPCHLPSDASFVATNLAAILAKRVGSCGLLDFQLRGGDLALLLKLAPRHTIIDLLSQQAHIDESMFQQALTSHESGIQLLAGPNEFTDLKNIRPQVCQQIISLAQRAQRFVLINAEDAQHAEQVRALAGSNDVVLTMRLDVVSLFRAKQHIDYMTRNRLAREHIHIAAVGTGYAAEIPTSTVKKVLQVADVHCIPDDPESAIRSVNVGSPVVIELPNSKISQALVALTDSLAKETVEPTAAPKPPFTTVKAAAVIALNTLPFCK